MSEIIRALDSFAWLSNLYVIDYFLDDHWSALPSSWREYFDALIAEHSNECLVELIRTLLSKTSTKKWPKCRVIVPLSLNLLRSLICRCSLPQHRPAETLDKLADALNLQLQLVTKDFTDIGDLDNSLRIKIKEKKLHEISRVYELVKMTMELCKQRSFDIRTIVDIGSGLGHLTRILSLHLDCQFKTIDGNSKLTARACSLDNKFGARRQVGGSWTRPSHRTKLINEADQIGCQDDENLLLIGLHTCGDLSSIILRNFTSNSNACALINFGCCYYKAASDQPKTLMFPMSKEYGAAKLSCAARELACHANEQYLKRATSNEMNGLANTYRALLEWLIVDVGEARRNNSARHKRMKFVKNVNQLDFWAYADSATSKRPEMNAKIRKLMTGEEIRRQVQQMVKDSVQRIQIIYSLRQMLGPLIETLILNDRKAFLDEHNLTTFLIPVFDPSISPRNVALVSIKNDI